MVVIYQENVSFDHYFPIPASIGVGSCTAPYDLGEGKGLVLAYFDGNTGARPFSIRRPANLGNRVYRSGGISAAPPERSAF